MDARVKPAQSREYVIAATCLPARWLNERGKAQARMPVIIR